MAQAPDEVEPALLDGLGGPERAVLEGVPGPSQRDPVPLVDLGQGESRQLLTELPFNDLTPLGTGRH